MSDDYGDVYWVKNKTPKKKPTRPPIERRSASCLGTILVMLSAILFTFGVVGVYLAQWA